MSYSRIPAELRALNQWILWKYVKIPGQEKPTKVPYQINGEKSNVIDPITWNTFDNCISVVEKYSGLGLVFSIYDEYSGIDLDYNITPDILATQLKIFNEFDSYSEISPS